jgi:acyl dehydratase
MADRVITTIEQLKELSGQELSVGEWHEITQDRVNAFADATGDHQWIHVDVERAKNGPFGGTIVHGFLTLAMAYGLRGRTGIKVQLPTKMGINYGLNRVRFPAPVRVGKRIRVRTKLLSVDEVAPNVYQQATEMTVDIEGEEKPAMVAEFLFRTYL